MARAVDAIAPLLVGAGFTVAAVDPPGCGRSGHRPKWAAYHDWEEAMPDGGGGRHSRLASTRIHTGGRDARRKSERGAAGWG